MIEYWYCFGIPGMPYFTRLLLVTIFALYDSYLFIKVNFNLTSILTRVYKQVHKQAVLQKPDIFNTSNKLSIHTTFQSYLTIFMQMICILFPGTKATFMSVWANKTLTCFYLYLQKLDTYHTQPIYIYIRHGCLLNYYEEQCRVVFLDINENGKMAEQIVMQRDWKR